MPAQLYIDIYKHWLLFMKNFGHIISLAFSDINSKAEALQAKLDKMKNLKTIEQLIDQDTERN